MVRHVRRGGPVVHGRRPLRLRPRFRGLDGTDADAEGREGSAPASLRRRSGGSPPGPPDRHGRVLDPRRAALRRPLTGPPSGGDAAGGRGSLARLPVQRQCSSRAPPTQPPDVPVRMPVAVSTVTFTGPASGPWTSR